MAEQNRKLQAAVFLRSTALELPEGARIALFNAEGQDFKGLQLTLGEDGAKFNGLARIFGNDDVKGVSIDMIQRNRETGEYEFVKDAPFASAELYVTDRKDADKPSFLSGRAYDLETTMAMREAGRERNTEKQKELREKGVEMTGNISLGFELLGAKPGVKKEKQVENKASAPKPGASL